MAVARPSYGRDMDMSDKRGRPARKGLVAGASTSRTKREVYVVIGELTTLVGIRSGHTGSVSFCYGVCAAKGAPGVHPDAPPLRLGSRCLAAGVGFQPLEDFRKPPHGVRIPVLPEFKSSRKITGIHHPPDVSTAVRNADSL